MIDIRDYPNGTLFIDTDTAYRGGIDAFSLVIKNGRYYFRYCFCKGVGEFDVYRLRCWEPAARDIEI